MLAHFACINCDSYFYILVFSKINPTIFKSYDVRGIYPSELNDEAAFEIGRTFVRQNSVKRVAIGQDARISSPALFRAFARGVCAEGGQVYDIGQVPTECVYFAVGAYNFDSGIMITASHNPKEYNGFKLMKKAGNDIQMVRGKDLFSVVDKLNPIIVNMFIIEIINIFLVIIILIIILSK